MSIKVIKGKLFKRIVAMGIFAAKPIDMGKFVEVMAKLGLIKEDGTPV